MREPFFFSLSCFIFCLFFFFNDTATTYIYTLSLHDALPIWPAGRRCPGRCCCSPRTAPAPGSARPDRKSTRLNSSHGKISYAVLCLKKKTRPWFAGMLGDLSAATLVLTKGETHV